MTVSAPAVIAFTLSPENVIPVADDRDAHFLGAFGGEINRRQLRHSFLSPPEGEARHRGRSTTRPRPPATGARPEIRPTSQSLSTRVFDPFGSPPQWGWRETPLQVLFASVSRASGPRSKGRATDFRRMRRRFSAVKQTGAPQSGCHVSADLGASIRRCTWVGVWCDVVVPLEFHGFGQVLPAGVNPLTSIAKLVAASVKT